MIAGPISRDTTDTIGRRTIMSKADLHVHSLFSKHPSHWFLQRIGASESYTSPDFIYKTAMERGMDFVTVTDHNRIEGSLDLCERYPDKAFTGVEVTSYFPEDGCKVHVLVYGLSFAEFETIQHLRDNIYRLRNYLLERGIAHSVAHATFSVNGRVSLHHLEKLILLFDVFEGVNGARNRLHNTTWMRTLMNLTPEHIDEMQSVHRIAPASADPWIKGLTGGSDDHAGLFIGKTYTIAEANSPDAFLSLLRSKKTLPDGRHNNYQSLAFMIYKIAYDFSRSRGTEITKSLVAQATDAFFNRDSLTLREQVSVKLLKTRSEYRDDTIRRLLLELLEGLNEGEQRDMDRRIDMVYDKIGDITDAFFKMVISSLMKDISSGNLEGFIRSVSSSLIGIFLSAPFFTTMRVMYDGRDLLQKLTDKFSLRREGERKKVLWFTDTFNEMNGVASTLREISALPALDGGDIRIVTALGPDRAPSRDTVLSLPSFYSFRVPNYETIELSLPSLLKSIRLLCEYDPDEVLISTPGPVGLLGLLLARLMNMKCVGIYHTDFAMQAAQLVDDDSMAGIVESYTRWFYSVMDEVLVPTREYIEILENRGIERSRMRPFKRAIDGSLFTPDATLEAYYQGAYALPFGFTALYAGRVSRDKNLDFLFEVFSLLRREGVGVNLVIAGDGPSLTEYKERYGEIEGLVFIGRIDRHEMPKLYASADLFVFPSITDTFGMAVLEAQACGIPALVTDIGGPQEIILNGHTGWVLDAASPGDWAREILAYADLKTNDRERYGEIRRACRENALTYEWEAALESILGPAAKGDDGASTRREEYRRQAMEAMG